MSWAATCKVPVFQSEIEPELAAFCGVKNLDKVQSSSSDGLRELLSAGSRNLALSLEQPGNVPRYQKIKSIGGCKKGVDLKATVG